MKYYLSLILVGTFIGGLFSAFAAGRITVTIERGGSFPVLDTRPQPEYNTSHIPGSVSLNPESLRGVRGGVPSILLPADLWRASSARWASFQKRMSSSFTETNSTMRLSWRSPSSGLATRDTRSWTGVGHVGKRKTVQPTSTREPGRTKPVPATFPAHATGRSPQISPPERSE